MYIKLFFIFIYYFIYFYFFYCTWLSSIVDIVKQNSVGREISSIMFQFVGEHVFIKGKTSNGNAISM